MPYRSLADFLEELAQAGQLIRVQAEVDPLLEVAEISDRIAKSGGGALLFGSVKGHQVPVLTNLLGTESRICRALGVGSLAETADRIALAVSPSEPEGWFEKLKMAPPEAPLKKLLPRSVKTGLCQQVVRLGSDVDLGELPLLQSWPAEGGRAITAGQLFTSDFDSGRRVVGRYDLQLLDRNRLAVCWGAHDEPARLLDSPGRRSEPMPLAVVLGGDPVSVLAAAAPLPPGVDGCALAGLLREKPLELVNCRSVELEVPADAEIVIEGYVDRRQPLASAGPLCTPSGYYGPVQPAPVMHVTAVTHRANPIYPAMVPGRPPHEACVMAKALWRILLPLVKLSVPELIDYELPLLGAARHVAWVSMRKTYAGQAHKVAHALWGLHPLMFVKLLVLVDEDLDVHDPAQVFAAVAAHVDPGRDVFFQQGPPDPLDVAAPPGALGQKMALDATAKLAQERAAPPSQRIMMSRETGQLVSDRWSEYGLGPAGDK